MKKLLALILSASMLFSFAACGGSSESKDDDSDKKNSSDIVENNGGVAEENNGFDAYKDDTQNAEYIIFGSYEQDNDLSNGKEPIEWLVLDEKDGKKLVVSRYVLDALPYNDVDAEVTWDTCSLRNWLNDEFFYQAFTNDEQAKIVTVTVNSDANPEYNTEQGQDISNKVFLLSAEEAGKYFDSNSERVCEATSYALAQGVWTGNPNSTKRSCWWWLRSLGEDLYHAVYVVNYGYVVNRGGDCDGCWDYGVRPAMWIEL